MIRFILILLVCSCIGIEASPDDLDDYRPKIHNEKRYEDLLEDPFNKRFLSIMLDPRADHGPSGFSMINRDEIAWCRGQGINAYPILLEVLKREPNPNAEDHGEIWHSVDFKKDVLYWIKDFPEGDTRPFIEEVRRQLPQWSERQIPNHDTHTGFIREALDLLAREGDESDIPLIESFLKDANRNNKHNAQTSLTKIKKRLASGSEGESWSPREQQPDERGKQKSSSFSNRKGQSHEEIVDVWKSNFLWIVTGLFILGVIALAFKFYQGNSKT